MGIIRYVKNKNQNTFGQIPCGGNASSFEAGDCDVTLTLTAANGTETRTLTYTVKVLKQESDKEIVDAASSRLAFSDISSEDIDNVTQNLTLMKSGR